MDRSVPGEGSSVHRRATMLVIAAAVVLAVVPASASAWVDDFFDGRASGQAVYEDMAIGPEAVRVGASVYCVYQGMGLDAYIIAFDDSGAIRGPFLVGHNPLSAGTDPDDSHGAPALLHDPVTGDLHVFWGSHTSPLQHAKTRTPGDITSWVPAASIPGNTSYAQVLRDDEGIVHLFYRLDDNSGAMVDGAPVMDRQGWWHATSADGGNTWGAPKPVVNGTPEVRWYAHFEKGPGGAIHVAMTPHLRKDPSPLARTGLFYARLDPDTGSWMNAAGSEIATPGAPIPAEACLEGSSGLTVSPVGAERQNGMSIAIDGSGDAVLVYVAGGEYGPGACRWESARFNGSRWVTTTITATDFLMDSGAVEYAADGTLEAFLTVGAGPAGPANDPYSFRGGDLEQWRSADDGATWQKVRTLRKADPSMGVVYNDPQIVLGHGATGPRVLFGEWDNDAGNFVHKLFLWGSNGFRSREFFPSLTRLEGADRYTAAVAVSRSAFPNGSDTVVIASGEVHADALAGGPLAAAYHAPLLLVKKGGVPGAVAAEVRRLRAKNVIVLGGLGTITRAAQNALAIGSVRSIRRIAGADRYAVAASVAAELAAVSGPTWPSSSPARHGPTRSRRRPSPRSAGRRCCWSRRRGSQGPQRRRSLHSGRRGPWWWVGPRPCPTVFSEPFPEASASAARTGTPCRRPWPKPPSTGRRGSRARSGPTGSRSPVARCSRTPWSARSSPHALAGRCCSPEGGDCPRRPRRSCAGAPSASSTASYLAAPGP
jgi:hypothetical protein